MNGKFVLLFLTMIALQVFPQGSIKIISSNRNSLIIEYTPSYSDTTVISINNQKFIKVGFKDGMKVKVYTISGRLIKEIDNEGISDRFVKIDWDGRDQDGDLPANGTYLYKVIVKSADSRLSKSVLGKMAIIR